MEYIADDHKSFATYLADKELSLRLIRWLLKIICVWPRSSNASIIERVLTEFFVLTYYFLIFSTMVPCGLAVLIEGRENTEFRMLHIGPLIYWVLASIKYFCLLLHVDDIRSCVECIEADWRTVRDGEDREVMLRSAKVSRFAAILIITFLHSGVQSYNVTRYLNQNVVNLGNTTVLIHELPYPFYNEILETRFSPMYEVILIMQVVSSLIVVGITIAICSMMVTFVMHACGQLEILTTRLYDIVDDNTDVRAMQQQLGFIVEHHLRVTNFVSHLEEIIHLTCLVELTGCSFLICLVGYCFITEWNQNRKQNISTYCMLGLSLVVNIFVLCYNGEILNDQYKQVGLASYMTEWYRLPRKIVLGLLLINMKFNSYNANLTAGKIIELSLTTFGNVLKTSVTYLNMLRAVTS